MATELAKAYVQVLPSTEGIEGELAKLLDKPAQQAGSSAGAKIASGIGTALAAGTTAIAGFATASVNAGSEFDKSMSQVAATMGLTTDEIGDLRDFALEMGSTTAFSATQAADALNYMALAGYSADESMEMLPNVLNLAAAGNIELARASDMVTDAQSALGLSFEEAGVLVDQMAMASSKSNTSVSQLGDAILTVGGTAKNLAGGTTELATALGILADNGVKGAEGGTALRNIILSLSAPTADAALMMDSLGVSVYDAEGNMRSMNDVFSDLDEGLSELTQEDRMQALSTIFNNRDLKSAEALLANVGGRWEELSGYIDDAQGSAEKMAATQLDNLAGDVTLFQSALEGAEIAVSDVLTPSLREFVQFGTSGVTQIAEAFQSDGLSGAASALGDVLSQGITMITGMLPDLVSAGGSLLLALAEGILSNAPQLVETAMVIITSLVNGLTAALPELIPIAVSAVLGIADALISNADQLLTAALQLIQALAQGLLDALPELIARLPEIISGIVSFLIGAIPQIIETGVTLLTALVENLPEIIEQIVEVLPELVEGIVSGIIDNLDLIVSAGVSLLVALVQNLPEIIMKIVEKLPELIEGLIDGLLGDDNISKMIDAGITLFVAILENTGEIIWRLCEKLPEIIEALVTGLVSLKDKMNEAGEAIVNGIWEGIKKLWDQLVEWFMGRIESMAKGVDNILGIHSPSKVFAEKGRMMALGLGEGFTDAMTDVRREIEGDMQLTSAISADVRSDYGGFEPAGYEVFNVTIDAASVREFNDIVNLAKNQRRLGRMVTA